MAEAPSTAARNFRCAALALPVFRQPNSSRPIRWRLACHQPSPGSFPSGRCHRGPHRADLWQEIFDPRPRRSYCAVGIYIAIRGRPGYGTCVSAMRGPSRTSISPFVWRIRERAGPTLTPQGFFGRRPQQRHRLNPTTAALPLAVARAVLLPCASSTTSNEIWRVLKSRLLHVGSPSTPLRRASWRQSRILFPVLCVNASLNRGLSVSISLTS